jgi:hypothetical protein
MVFRLHILLDIDFSLCFLPTGIVPSSPWPIIGWTTNFRNSRNPTVGRFDLDHYFHARRLQSLIEVKEQSPSGAIKMPGESAFVWI